MKHLKYCLMTAGFDCSENRHAQVVMKELGITYKLAVPQSMADQWQFFCCENLPEELPKFLTEICKDNNFKNYSGISEDNLKMLKNSMKKEKV